ncbi:Sjoegren syndrome/scleroderma autoantigen 1 [Trinorchestia longiramus]|nr:Sjoegren syndrome/scleroderma autoantigen 1 [Trinorchestia longiramus]
MSDSAQMSSGLTSNVNGNAADADTHPVPADLDDFNAVDWMSRGGIQDPITREKSRSDIVAHEMGQLLLKGYKMLATVCNVCNCILMEDKQGHKLCIGCSLDSENKFKEPCATAPAVSSPASVVATFKNKQKAKSSKVSNSSSSSQKKVLVQGVDLSDELQQVVTSLKDKLVSLSSQLYSTDDHSQLSDCLASIATTVSVLEKIKLIS